MNKKMTYSEGRGPAYINPFYCSLCQSHLGNMICHSQEDSKEIYDLLLAKQTGMLCMSCSQRYSLKEGFNEVQDEQMKEHSEWRKNVFRK